MNSVWTIRSLITSLNSSCHIHHAALHAQQRLVNGQGASTAFALRHADSLPRYSSGCGNLNGTSIETVFMQAYRSPPCI